MLFGLSPLPPALADLPLLAALLPLLLALLGLALDRRFGEVPRWHPLVGFGRLVNAIEGWLNLPAIQHLPATRVSGLFAWASAVLPLFGLSVWLHGHLPWWGAALLDSGLLYFAIGARSLEEHGQRVADDLAANDLPAAREHVGWMVSRDTSVLDEQGVAKATLESLLENGNDAIFGALFWFALLGGPGALLFRLANTLDAMWGYRTERYNLYGRFAARFDDLLNWLPARLTALSYALLGRTGNALACWRTQAPGWDSPNAGPVMAAGAGSLGVQLGGAAIYHGQLEQRPPLGNGPAPVAGDLARAVVLIRRSLWLWLAAFFVLALLGTSLNGFIHA